MSVVYEKSFAASFANSRCLSAEEPKFFRKFPEGLWGSFAMDPNTRNQIKAQGFPENIYPLPGNPLHQVPQYRTQILGGFWEKMSRFPSGQNFGSSSWSHPRCAIRFWSELRLMLVSILLQPNRHNGRDEYTIETLKGKLVEDITARLLRWFNCSVDRLKSNRSYLIQLSHLQQ